MNRRNGPAVFAGIVLFGTLIAAAILAQSAYLLYAASGIPILLVPFLPDIKTSKVLKPGKPSSGIRMYRTSDQEGGGFLVIEGDAGSLPWNKRRLYFQVEGVPSVAPSPYSNDTAGIPVLAYDLVHHPRKKQLYGIELAHLNARFRTLSYTPEEATRLIIRMEDLQHQAFPPQESIVTPPPGMSA
ncbi:MAG: hypothetical protein K0R57_4266 [Paenibacillaceae bacterium]|jgi:hypothetical protein|nr:hypothetical protein [Paenibacillaceae bacterium]